VLPSAGVVCGTSRRGGGGDNAPVGSFFGSLERALGAETFATREQARAAISEAVEAFGSRVRRRSSLGYVSPVEFERAHDQTHR
jgi:putative transposase